MASETLSDAQRDSDPKTGEARRVRPEQADRITARIALLQWIESARTELEHLHNARASDEALDERMTRHYLVSGMQWGYQASDALHGLMEDLAEDVEDMAAKA